MSERTLNRPTLLWLAAGVLALGGAAAWGWRTAGADVGEQRRVAETAVAWALHGCVVLGLAGFCGVARPVWAVLGRRGLAKILTVAVVAWVVAGLAPRTHRIFFDEQIYMQVGQTYAHTGRLAAASYARVEHGKFEFYDGELNKQPQAWPYVYGQAARVFGVSPRLGQELNRALVAVVAGLLCLALLLAPWRLPTHAPVAVGLAWALTPLVPWWGRTAAVEPSAAAGAAAAFAAAVIYVRLRTPSPAVEGRPAAGALLAAATAMGASFRPESLLVFPLVALVLWADEDEFVRDLVAWGALAFALALLAPTLAQLWAVRGEDWGATDGRRFNFGLVGENLRSNAGYFFLGREFPVAGTVLAVVGFGWLVTFSRPAAVVLAGWFLPAWGVFVLFYAGGYHYGASNRFAVISAAPVALAMGVGAAALLAMVRRRPAWGGAAAALVGLSWAHTYAFVSGLGREAIEVQEEVEWAAEQARRLPSGSLVISQAPSLWLIEGRNSATWPAVESLARGQLHELANQYPGGVYLHFGFWDNAEGHRADEAARIIVEYGAREITRFGTHAMTFGLFRIDTPVGLARYGGPAPAFPSRREGELDNALWRAGGGARAADAAREGGAR